MFFFLSKIIGFFLFPSTFLCILLILGLWLGKTMLSLAVITLIITAFSPLGNWLMVPLEERFTRPIKPLTPLTGIIILGGSIDTLVTRARGTIAVNEAGERLIEVARLARRFPKAKIIFSGGSGQLLYQTMSEANAAQQLFSQMGISPHNLVFERQSKNTWQNAMFTKALLKPEKGQRWLLVTSAFHMARSIGCFRKAGMNVIPWPVDYRTRGNLDLYRFFNRASEGWKRVDTATREWIGLLVYRVTGRTMSFFPR